ncbi:hypothetical protein BJ138DRAFT_1106625, partial [Hygrophoropsis aurantiaca]
MPVVRSSDSKSCPPPASFLPRGPITRARARAFANAQLPIVLCQIEEAKKEIALLKARRDTRRRAADQLKAKIISVRNEAIRCGICNGVPRRPFTTSCGHSFCYPCIRDDFQRTIAGQISRRPGLPSRFKLPPYTDDDLRYLYSRSYLLVPLFACNTCLTRIKEKPSEPVALKSLLEVIKKHFGDVAQVEAGISHLCADEDLWRGVFTKKDHNFMSILYPPQDEDEIEAIERIEEPVLRYLSSPNSTTSRFKGTGPTLSIPVRILVKRKTNRPHNARVGKQRRLIGWATCPYKTDMIASPLRVILSLNR